MKSLGGNDPDFRIVIFVDDLDRCQYEAMFRLMESMKLFFDIAAAAFRSMTIPIIGPSSFPRGKENPSSSRTTAQPQTRRFAFETTGRART